MVADDQVPQKVIEVGSHPNRADRSAAVQALRAGRRVVILGRPRAVARLTGQVLDRLPDVVRVIDRPNAETAPGSGERVTVARARACLAPWHGQPLVMDTYWPSAELGAATSRRRHSP